MSALPFVYLNLAITADGKIAAEPGTLSKFGSRRDLEHLYELRAEADAIVCGAGTVNAERADLGSGPRRFQRQRLKAGRTAHPVRVVVSGAGRIETDSNLFRRRFGPIVMLVTEQTGRRRLRELQAVADAVRVCGEREIDFVSAFGWLGAEWGVKRLLGEGGGRLNEALFRAGVVRELHLTICPVVMGGAKAPTIADGQGVRRLAMATQCRLKRMRRVGSELFVVFSVRQTGKPGGCDCERKGLGRPGTLDAMLLGHPGFTLPAAQHHHPRQQSNA
jgi:2,5-diamino-6-(ribosylamino)-4(3H)-pyrimidinone 5'-phosphate reductase